jgi:hypothetical protein
LWTVLLVSIALEVKAVALSSFVPKVIFAKLVQPLLKSALLVYFRTILAKQNVKRALRGGSVRWEP